VTAEECGWLCTILLPEGAQLAGTPSYRAGVFTFAADRAGKISLSMQPQKSGIAGIATAFVDNTGKPSISNWILPAFRTLDFDDNGSVEIADALYLYNYVNSGLPLKGARWFSEAHLGQHTTATRRQWGNAMKTLQEMRGDLDYDASGAVDNDDAVYVYNFIAAGCPAEDSPEFSAESLKKNTSGAGGRHLQETLDRLRELSND
jgi:hypothetical protein